MLTPRRGFWLCMHVWASSAGQFNLACAQVTIGGIFQDLSGAFLRAYEGQTPDTKPHLETAEELGHDDHWSPA